MKTLYFFSLVIIFGLLSCTDSGEKQEIPIPNKAKNMTKNHSESSLSTPTKNKGKEIKTDEKSYPSPKEIAVLMGKFEPKGHPEFVLIDKRYADRSGMYIHKKVYTAYRRMYQAALKDGVKLQIRSATRNFNYQKGIWERKWTGRRKVNGKDLSKSIQDPVLRAKEILKYSSMPGSSRHHWGTDIDLNSFDNSWFEHGKGKIIYDWLQNNAAKYGFCQVYTDKGLEKRTGYEEEKWHWSYQPISKKYTQLASKYLKDNMFEGFKGSETAVKVNIVEKYILGVSKTCKYRQ